MKVLRHEDVCTLLERVEDRDILTRPLFDVIIHLFHSSSSYRKLVLSAASYIEECVKTEKEGYGEPKGWSGANAGIPWNIISVMVEGAPWTMLNPYIVPVRGEGKRVVMTNCGSLRLPLPIKVERWNKVDVYYHDLTGIARAKTVGYGSAFTIQHETQHNQGILITDLEVGKVPERTKPLGDPPPDEGL